MRNIVCGHLEWCANELDNSLPCDCGADATREELEALRELLKEFRERIDTIATRSEEGAAYDLLRLSAKIDAALRDKEGT